MKRVKYLFRYFRIKLIIVFGTIILIPIVLLNMLLYYSTVDTIKKNVEELTTVSLKQTQKSVRTTIGSYEDVLYQIYADDDIVALVDGINEEENLAVSRNQLRRILRGMMYSKDHIQGITIITTSGDLVFYDKLTAAAITTSWMEEGQADRIYETFSQDNKTRIMPSQKAGNLTAKPYYLFHIGHRIIDYRNIIKKSGVAIVTIDVNLLNGICNDNIEVDSRQDDENMNFIVDKNGCLISFPDQEKIGMTIFEAHQGSSYSEQQILEFLKENRGYKAGSININHIYDEQLGWYFYNVSNQGRMMRQLQEQRRLTYTLMALFGMAALAIVYLLSGHLTVSIRQVVSAMKKVEEGNIQAEVEVDQKMPLEIEKIATQFNHMIRELNQSLEQEKMAAQRQKNAEIRALEAQINPHFLYNMLDTINWMVIEKEEYEISETINALGHILRYGINNSTGMVSFQEELKWLEQYILLQKSRLKDTFQCNIDADARIMDCRIHKLLFQPFVENAILHGFKGVDRQHILNIAIRRAEDKILIRIQDNGKGMEQEMVDKFLDKQGLEEEDGHIGIRNAIGRLYMYYPEGADVSIQSEPGKGTDIVIEIPWIETGKGGCLQ